ncbi:MAG TPA: hypothetical protein VFW87_12100 [Pirellulales bacterium]|nr:hypothetical protein [Pirellulales bacterium]
MDDYQPTSRLVLWRRFLLGIFEALLWFAVWVVRRPAVRRWMKLLRR